jgi:hypothetical protein
LEVLAILGDVLGTFLDTSRHPPYYFSSTAMFLQRVPLWHKYFLLSSDDTANCAFHILAQAVSAHEQLGPW